MASGENNGRWKGKDASYAAIHIWMKNTYGKPQKCEHCNTTEDRMYHWANISGTYQRDREDWLRLCVPCHKRNDIKALGGKIKRTKMVQPTKTCAECGITFFKNPRYSQTQWSATLRCSKACSSKEIARKKLGITQSAETKALKSQKLRERWATNEQWRENQVKRMLGNKYAIGITNRKD